MLQPSDIQTQREIVGNASGTKNCAGGFYSAWRFLGVLDHLS
jgi:hypothetical protein